MLPVGTDGKCTVTVCGGGNASHTLIGYIGSRTDAVINLWSLYGDEAERFAKANQGHDGKIRVINDLGDDVIAAPAVVTKTAAEVIPQTQILVLALPAFIHEQYLREAQPFIQPGTMIVALPAQGGFDFSARDIFGDMTDQVILVGGETLPWAVRIEEFGVCVQVKGTKKQVDIAVSPRSKATEAASVLQQLLGRGDEMLPKFRCYDNFLNPTMMNINSVWHPPIMYGRLRNWDGKTPFSEPPLFYQGVDAETAYIMTHVSLEVLDLKSEIQRRYQTDLQGVRLSEHHLRRAYGEDIKDGRTLVTALHSNKGYQGLTHPTIKIDGGYMIDFKYRYLAEDVPFGLLVTRGIAELFGVKTPTIDKVLLWAQEKMGKSYLITDQNGQVTCSGPDIVESRCPQRYGYTNAQELMEKNRYLQETCKL